VVGDVDGITVVPRDALSDVMGAGRARAAKEAGFFAALNAGQTTVQLLDLDASLIAGVDS
jgi:regulator of RNase E activity RraA